jgi:hypothetical protein
MAGVVGVTREDGEGTVDLFGEDGAGELVGEGNKTEREQQVGAVSGCGGPAVGGAYAEDEALGSGVAELAHANGNFIRRQLASATVQEYCVGPSSTGLAGEPVKEGGFGVEELGLARKIVVCSINVLGY